MSRTAFTNPSFTTTLFLGTFGLSRDGSVQVIDFTVREEGLEAYGEPQRFYRGREGDNDK